MCKCKYCGKELERSKIGGHTFACEKNPNYKKNINRSSIQFKNYNQKRRENTHYGNCLQCGAKLDKPNKKFCNSSCAAKYNNSKRKEEGKTSKGKTKIVNCLNCGNKITISIFAKPSSWLCNSCKPYKNYKKYYTISCKICHKEFKTTKKDVKYCSHKCSNSDPEVREKLRQKQYKLIKEGLHKGWQSRDIISYPEQFWMKVLDNNEIKYIHNKYIKEYGYFLDFFIEQNNKIIDLEIDGKQHTYKENIEKDHIRDERISNMGYIVYRIPWNEINSENGKIEMQNKINEFLKFINLNTTSIV